MGCFALSTYSGACPTPVALPRKKSALRIVFLIHELALNGAVLALFEQARFLSRRGHTITIATPQLNERSGVLTARFEAEGARIVRSLVIAEHDVAVGCTVFAVEYLQHLLGSMPVVWWIHEGRAGIDHVLGHAAGLRLLEQADTLIFPTREVADKLYAPLLAVPQQIEVIPCIVRPPPPGEAAPKSEGILRMLCVGSVCPRKRQIDLVRAVSLLGGRAECVLVGEMFELPEPGTSIVKSAPDRFRLTGGLLPEAVAQLYRSADVFCLPSGDESMPIAPVEAAWHGVPVVLSNLDCYAGIWRHDHNALLYPVGDVAMLAWQIRMLLNSPSLRQRLVQHGRRTAARFSAKRNGGLFEAALKAALE